MSLIRRRRWFAGLVLGLVLAPATSAPAQDLPPALPPTGEPAPPLPALPPLPAEPPPVARPTPPVVEVPPMGVGPTWRPSPIDPVALERKSPRHVWSKARSWPWRRLQGKLWGYPEEYEPRVLGASLYENSRIMVANGAAAKLVLYQYDFREGSPELSPRGLDQLAKFSAQLAASPYPLIVERTPDNPSLSESRRYAVLARLALGPCPLPSDRVLVGVPIPHGMSGTDAQIVAGNSLNRTLQYGPPIPILSNGVNSPSGVTSSNNAGPGTGYVP